MLNAGYAPFAPVIQNSVRYLIFYNLKKPKPLFIISGKRYIYNPSFENIYNFIWNLTFNYFTLQFFRVAEMTYCYIRKHAVQ